MLQDLQGASLELEPEFCWVPIPTNHLGPGCTKPEGRSVSYSQENWEGPLLEGHWFLYFWVQFPNIHCFGAQTPTELQNTYELQN